jgi:predicted DNA binding CopG/RHH family protein
MSQSIRVWLHKDIFHLVEEQAIKQGSSTPEILRQSLIEGLEQPLALPKNYEIIHNSTGRAMRESKIEVVRKNVRIHQEVYDRVKEKASANGWSISKTIRAAITRVTYEKKYGRAEKDGSLS